MTIAGWKIMITGGSGFIGSRLITHLVEGGAQVQVLTRNPDRVSKIPGVDYLALGDRSPQGWVKQIETTDAIVNLAGASLNKWPWSQKRIQEIRNSRTSTGKALVEAIRTASHKPRVLIQSSAIGYYGNTGDQLVDEASPPGKDVMAGVVVDWENSTKAVEEMGVRRVIIRTTPVLDAHEGILPVMALPFKLFVGGSIGNGRQWVPWIHVNDEIQAILFLLEDENLSGPFILGSPVQVTNAEFGKALAKVLHRPYWFPAPAILLRLALGRMSSLILEGQRANPTRLLLQGFSFHYPEISTALNNIYNVPIET